jgi:hypothetical protein
MNLVKSPYGATLAALLAAAGLAACGERHSDVPPGPSTASPSAVVIGTSPAAPSGDPPGTTAVSAPSEVSKPVEQRSMPLPGQPNDHSNLAAAPSENAEAAAVLKSPELAKKANSGPPLDERKTQ